MNILVTAANGNLGKEITRQLLNDHTVTGAVRTPATVDPVNDVNYVAFDYDAPHTYTSALGTAQAVVLQAPPLDADADRRLTPFIAAMKAAGIRRVVFISAYGVNHNEAAPLRKLERMLMDQDFDYTFIRPNFFMENFTTGFAAPALEHDNIVLSSAGDGRISFVSIKDIAAVVAAALSDTGLAEREYNLTGPAALSHGDVAALISAAKGTPVAYVSLSAAELKAGAMQNGLPEAAADYLIKLYELAGQGLMAGLSDDVETALGRVPTGFETLFTA